MQPSDMKGKVALVTGAARGLGRATALRLARAGADLALVDRDEAPLAETALLAEAQGVRALALPLDLAEGSHCSLAVARTLETFGRLDALCNVAAVLGAGRTEELDDETIDRVLAVNLAAPLKLIRSAMPHLIRAGGAVVNVTSCAAFQGQAYLAAYSAAKAGLTHLTRSLAMEYIKTPVRINAVAPGGMRTALAAGFAELRDPDPELLGRIQPLRGVVEVEAVAEVVAFLASDAARGFHGACINLDNGVTAG